MQHRLTIKRGLGLLIENQSTLLYLRDETLFLLGCQKEADHPKELQVDGGHLDLPQSPVHQADGQVQSLVLEMQHLLGWTDMWFNT